MFLFFFNPRKVALTGIGAGPRQGQIGLPSTTGELCGPGQGVQAIRTHSPHPGKGDDPYPHRIWGGAQGEPSTQLEQCHFPTRCAPTSGHCTTAERLGNEAGRGVSGRGGREGQPCTRRRPACRSVEPMAPAQGRWAPALWRSCNGLMAAFFALAAVVQVSGPGGGRRVAGEGEGPMGPAGRRASCTSPGPACSVHNKPAGAQKQAV